MKYLKDLTPEIALDESIELWVFLAKTGGPKLGWAGWNEWRGHPRHYCFFCHLRNSSSPRCQQKDCPLWDSEKDECCWGRGQPYNKWVNSITLTTRRYYAALVLAQLMEAKNENNNKM